MCRFFLEQAGPTHLRGDYQMIPFLVNMARLFELFVYEWLRDKFPKGLVIKPQERIQIGETIHFIVDLVLYSEHRAECILDTKYKDPRSPPDPREIAQAVAYAESLRCKQAILLYPRTIQTALDVTIGDIRVCSLAFDLEGDIENAGREMLSRLGAILNVPAISS